MARPLPKDLPDHVREAMAPYVEPDMARLDAIGTVIADKFKEAKDAREQSGIEVTWAMMEEAYAGIDDANRAEMGAQGRRWQKPMSPDGPLTRDVVPGASTQHSTVFVRLTSRYVDAGAAKLGEILLPLDDKAFTIEPTPVPELIALPPDNHIVGDDGVPWYRPLKQGETNPAAAAPPSAPAAVAAPAGGAVPPAGAVAQMAAQVPGAQAAPQPPPGQVPLTVKDVVEEQTELATKKAKKAEKRLYDWDVECQYPMEARKVIFDSARLGVGVLKGPFSKPNRSIVVSKQGGGVAIEIRDDIKPASKWVDAWNIFPDPACGEMIRDGEYVFERDWLTYRQVRELRKAPGYITTQIDKVLLEGPVKTSAKSNESQPNKTEEQKKNRFEVHYFYGQLSRDDMECICQAAGKVLKNGDAAPGKDVFAIVTTINDHVVKAAFNPLDTGSLPYYNMPWSRRPGHWAGIGVGEQLVTPQRIVNGAMRGMLDNAGVSAGGQIVINTAAIAPGNGDWTITPNKIWYLQTDTGMTVAEAFGVFQFPNVTAQMEQIVLLGLKLGEESTNIPLVTQGQSGPTQPETLGGLQLQNNNANQLLRSIGYSFDDYVTEPRVRNNYEWLLLDPSVSDDEKGDFTINAHGSAALVERAIQDQVVAQILPASLNPAYKLDPAKSMEELLKSKRLDPRAFKRDEAEQQRIDEAGVPPAPQVQAAQVQAQAKVEAAQIVGEVEKDKATAEGHVAIEELRVKERIAIVQERIAIMEAAKRENTSIEQIKAALAQTAMKLNVQKELSAVDNRGPGKRINRQRRGSQVLPPPTEPAGRAPNGKAFQA